MSMFKIFHKRSKKFIDWEEFHNFSEVILFPYSGINDKHEKEIYLNYDIVKLYFINDEFKEEVVYTLTGYLYLCPKSHKIVLNNYETFDIRDADEIEIVDNLYNRKEKKKIFINYDYSTYYDCSYSTILKELKEYNGTSQTNCLQFFKDFKYDVTIRCRDGRYINNQELLLNTGEYTDKEIRKEHDILKIFLAGGFKWKKK